MEPTGPFEHAGIRNFGWVEQGAVARGEQPLLKVEAFRDLRRAGIGRVLSLRETGEQSGVVFGHYFPGYRPEEEADLCRQAGLAFDHVSCRDGQAPSPESVARSLEIVRDAARQGAPVFLHCVAGVGRTGIVAAAWLMHRGLDSTEAGRHFLAYMVDMVRRIEEETGEEQVGSLRNRAISEQWWSLQHIAAALGSPVVDDDFAEVGPLKPPYADGWADGYPRLLRSWRVTSKE
ncbi:MAG: protein-tyrosine phosphatase family protein [Anaerolineae bacterium]